MTYFMKKNCLKLMRKIKSQVSLRFHRVLSVSLLHQVYKVYMIHILSCHRPPKIGDLVMLSTLLLYNCDEVSLEQML